MVKRPTSTWRTALAGALLAILCAAPLGAQETERPWQPFHPDNLRFRLDVTTARPLSMGGAAIALPDDPSATALNPAGTALFNRPAFSFSTRFRREESREPSFGLGDLGDEATSTQSFFDQVFLNAVLPVFGLRLSSHREVVMDSRLALHRLRPFLADPGKSLDAVLAEAFPSRATTLRIQVVDNTGTAAYRFSERLNVGVTVRLTRMEYVLSEREYLATELPDPGIVFGEVSQIRDDHLYLMRAIDERAWKAGFGVGLLSRVNSRLLIGAVYHYYPTFTLDQRLHFPDWTIRRGGQSRAFAAPASNGTASRIDFNLPDLLGFGLTYKYPGWLNAAVDVRRVAYSQMLEMGRDRDGRDFRDIVQDGSDDAPDVVLEDVWQLRAGMEYILKLPVYPGRLPLRLGWYRDPAHRMHAAAENDPLLRAALPEGEDLHHVTGGFGIFLNAQSRFDLAVDVSARRFELLVTSAYTF